MSSNFPMQYLQRAQLPTPAFKAHLGQDERLDRVTEARESEKCLRTFSCNACSVPSCPLQRDPTRCGPTQLVPSVEVPPQPSSNCLHCVFGDTLLCHLSIILVSLPCMHEYLCPYKSSNALQHDLFPNQSPLQTRPLRAISALPQPLSAYPAAPLS